MRWRGCSLAGNQPVPDWTRPYLGHVAVGISRLLRGQGRIPRKGAIAPAIARILFPRRGRTNPFDAIKADVHELLIAHDAACLPDPEWLDLTRGTLARTEAELLERVATLEDDVRAYQVVAHEAIAALHVAVNERDRLRHECQRLRLALHHEAELRRVAA